ncbi:hypothetical protein NBRC110019_08150 [Neptunitalea chrysea]|uniref:MetA-pathway of phenol degradation n=1 Tax=Neptunitalea chrysea TaxID=1647581 RepID=A0A9W6B3H6_9FLAO|nr:hypothetical protein [Neptunitalea chrysea]GLB51776.1 hypothetical protein NBRC110019_08150 [Neptunitalea chrysea]
MKKLVYIAILILGTSVGFSQSNSQTISDSIPSETMNTYKPFNFNLQVKNMHLWRGYRVTDAPMTAGDVNYTSKNGKFKAGLWGGSGFNGDYHEFDYYISYATGGWSLAIWDINNYSAYPDAEIFNYDISKTSHFIDVTLAHQFQKIPLKLSWSTIIQGRDTYMDENGELKNAFSNYVEASYTLRKETNWSLSAFVGGVFSFANDIDESNFYGDKSSINNVGLVYNRDLNILDKVTLPVSATAMWNPLQKYGAMQVAVNLF